MPISRCRFNANGQLFAYASCYDWHKGFEGHTTKGSQVFIHEVKEDEIKPKPKASTTTGRR